MNKQQSLDFAKRSASIGLDVGEVLDYRDNVIDTLKDEGAAEYIGEALELFDKLTAR